MRLSALLAATALTLAAAAPALAQDEHPAPPKQRNVVIFVADGLRYSSVTPQTAPTMYKLRQDGVDFSNSHAVYPTLTTANASAIATGHFLGDTGNYANTLWLGFPIQCSLDGAPKLTFVEDDCVLRKVKEHFGSGYVGQDTLIQAANKAGYSTVVVGKKGPAGIQYLEGLDSKNELVTDQYGYFIDESTGRPKNIDGTPTMSTMFGDLLIGDVFGVTGSGAPPFTTVPNLSQQAFLESLTTQAIIPRLQYANKPFVMLYWSRDPDTTQHGAHDSDGKLLPGINSETSRRAIYNADSNLKGILDALKLWKLDDNTDVFVIADHGFSTIAHGIPTPDGDLVRSTLGRGFVALDIADWLGGQKVFDPDHGDMELDRDSGERPTFGSGLIGPSAEAPLAMVAANGGTDFIYVPEGPDAQKTLKTIYDNLVQQPYVSALFVNDDLRKGHEKDFAGSLPLSAINMVGAGGTPRPAIVIGFRSFVVKGCTLGEQLCAAEIADTNLQTGQGMHGSFSRADTRNFMAAIGPDFKKGYVAKTPVGNVDVAPTAAHILGITLTGPGTLKGRVIEEAFIGGKEPKVTVKPVVSDKAPNGFHTVLEQQEVDGVKYFDVAGKPGTAVGLKGN